MFGHLWRSVLVKKLILLLQHCSKYQIFPPIFLLHVSPPGGNDATLHALRVFCVFVCVCAFKKPHRFVGWALGCPTELFAYSENDLFWVRRRACCDSVVSKRVCKAWIWLPVAIIIKQTANISINKNQVDSVKPTSNCFLLLCAHIWNLNMIRMAQHTVTLNMYIN